MNRIYTAWFSDEGEDKGDTMETFSALDAAVLHYIEHQADVLPGTRSVFVRPEGESVKEFGVDTLPVLPLGESNQGRQA